MLKYPGIFTFEIYPTKLLCHCLTFCLAVFHFLHSYLGWRLRLQGFGLLYVQVCCHKTGHRWLLRLVVHMTIPKLFHLVKHRLEVCEVFTVSRSQIRNKFPISVFARVCDISTGFEANAYMNEIRLLTCRKMSTVSYKEVGIVIATTVEASERFKLREALIGYLPYPYALTGFLLKLF